MSGFLIDTHVLLWWAHSPDQIDSAARLVVANGRNQIFVSLASIWEMNIKIGRGRLELPAPPSEMLRRSRFQALPIAVEHIELVRELPDYHRDPFDRMLIAQAQAMELTIITRDRTFRQYDVATIAA